MNKHGKSASLHDGYETRYLSSVRRPGRGRQLQRSLGGEKWGPRKGPLAQPSLVSGQRSTSTPSVGMALSTTR